MTKSTITREQLEEWVAQFDEDGGCDATDRQLEALIRQSLAAMDSEPEYLPLDYLQGHKDGLEWAAQLAKANHPETGDWLYDDPIELAKAIRKGPDMPPVQPVADSEPVIVVGDDGGDALSYRRLIQSFEPGTKLYRHAQQPVVPEKATVGEMPFLGTSEGAYVRGWNDCRAAMLQENAKSAGVSNNCRSSENVQVMQDHQIRELVNQLRDIAVKYHAAGQLREQIARVIRAAMLQAGNSPVIPDGWTGNDKANAALMMLDRIETADPVDDDRIDGIKRIVRELAAAPHDTPALNPVQSVVTVPGKWIPVSERIPEDDDFVYIWPRPDFGVELHVGQYCERSHKGGGWYAQVYEQNYGIEWHPITVTHWMPLPAAPQEVRGE
ncbi:DUF551 domain-containing protein [Klebsiella pneumoniae]|uniref:DUF551 domain-containing protein n=1 Tax=Klebsiella pneumoniae TaxID=573 RepID=UPI002F963AC7